MGKFTGKRKGHTVKSEKPKLANANEVADAIKAAAAEKREVAPAPEAKPVLIKVLKRDAKYRGAREAWYQRLLEFDGKSVDEYIESCKTNCPQLTKNQTAENPTGWVGFFKRQGIIQEVNPT